MEEENNESKMPLMSESLHYKLFGYPVDVFTKKTLINCIADKVSVGEKYNFVHINLHGLYWLLNSEEMNRFFSQPNSYVYIDGMPIVRLLQLNGAKVSGKNRLTSLDWTEELLHLAAKSGWRVAYIGSTADICRNGVNHFTNKIPELDMLGWDGFFDMSDETPGSKLDLMINEVNEYKPDILLIGMGMPRQEVFLQSFESRLDFKASVCLGAFVEYFVGGQPLPPRWMGRFGLEWSYRFIHNPKRYFARYFVEPFFILFLLLKRKILRKK